MLQLMRCAHGVRVHGVQEAPTGQYLIPLFIKNAMGPPVSAHLRGELADPALDFQCAFSVLCRKLFVPLQELTPFFSRLRS